MTIRLNGQEQTLSESHKTVAALLAFFGIRPERVAVEINGEIIEPARFDTTPVHNGDRVEIVSFVGGG